MLNGVFRIGVVNRSQQPQQQKHHAPPLLAKQHPVIKESDSNTPTRRALAPVSGNQVNAMQRIRNFVSGPLSQPSFVVASDVPQLTASAKKKACNSGKKERRQLQEQAARTVTQPNFSSHVVAAVQSASSTILSSADHMALVTKEMNLATAINARAVCKTWKGLVKEADLEPLEAGQSEEEQELGRQSQQHLEEALRKENEVWTSAHSAAISQHLTRQTEITSEMRKTLLNWLIEVHFKFRFREPCLHLTIQLVDRYLSSNVVTRRKYQTVGVTAFMLGCKYEERHNPNLMDLSYITDYSSTKQDIIEMEKEMLLKLKFDMKHPKPTDFLERFSKAAKLESTKRTQQQYTKSYSITLYFLDISFMDESLAHTRPSLLAAAAIMCTLRVLGKADWTPQLEHYTTYMREQVKPLANRLIANGRSSQASSLQLKYTSRRMGGHGDQFGPDGRTTINDGCLHIIKAFYARA